MLPVPHSHARVYVSEHLAAVQKRLSDNQWPVREDIEECDEDVDPEQYQSDSALQLRK